MAATSSLADHASPELPEHPALLWRNPDPKPSYEVVIVGAGGHGLATAYYLAKEHGITDVAVLEKGWLGGGNMGRNTTIIRELVCSIASSSELAEAIGAIGPNP